MKQLTLVVLKSEQATALEALQDLGVLHLAMAPAPPEEAVVAMRARLQEVRRAAEVLAGLSDSDSKPTSANIRLQATEIVTEVQRLSERLSDLNYTQLELLREQERLAPFGNFEPDAIHRLQAQGIGVRLLRHPVRQAFEPPDKTIVLELSHDRRQRYLALVGPVAAVMQSELAPDEVLLPDASPAALSKKLVEVERVLALTSQELTALAEHLEALRVLADRTEDRLRFEEARAAMAVVGVLAYLRGFCPEREVPQLQALAEAQGWGLLTEEITDPHEVPTKIENPRWVKPIEPVISFLGVIPGYDQVDVSAPFLIFFSLFFAMIVGDAGYGLLFLLLTLWGQRRYAAPAKLFSLLKLLSVATIVWGVLTGSYFGLAAIPALLRLAQLTWLMEQDNIILLSFIIGTVHLTLAHGWNAVRFFPSTRTLAQIGWICTTWTMFFLARTLVLGSPFPAVMLPVLAVGVVLIVLFMTPWRQLKQEWFNHAMLPLTLVSNFVDVISYVRLFAVGAATFAVASAFNEMALAIGAGGLLASILAALILFFGHTLNILLAAMGVLVHGVRLNTLEFAGHLGMSWSGRPYLPFARKARREVV